MNKQHYEVCCYTCQHNGRETCQGCNTFLNGENEPYENWRLREDLEAKDQQIVILEKALKLACERLLSIEESIYYDVNVEDIIDYYIEQAKEMGKNE